MQDLAVISAKNVRSRGRPRATSRDEIRDIAMSLFLRHGYAETSLAQIAAAAGVSRTTLFAYFPAKRDIVWVEFERALARVPGQLAALSEQPIVDAVGAVVAGLADFGVEDRATLRERWRMVHEDDVLRAHVVTQSERLSDVILAAMAPRQPAPDPSSIDHVTHALLAVAGRCTHEWAGGAGAGTTLHAYTTSVLQPFVVALRPLVG